ncbi:MAG: hypothetical protein ABI068_03205 [Ktedonobacterales bacterium]
MSDRHKPSTASDDEQTGANADAPDALVFESDVEGERTLWGRRLTRRSRLWRAGAGVAIVLLVAYVLVGGPAATMAALTAAWASHAPAAQAAAQPAFAGASYNPMLLPPGSIGASALHVAPAPSAGAIAYTCWIAPRTTHPDGSPSPNGGPLHLYSTTSLGDTWQPLTLPRPTSPDCALVVDGANPRGVALLLGANLLTDVSCTLPTVYVSEDGGQSWQFVAWPDAQRLACNFHLAFETGLLFAWADTPLLPASQTQFSGPGRVMVSRDDGRLWRAADTGLPSDAHFTLLGMRAEDPTGLVRMLAQVDKTTPTASSWLAQSWDSGASWEMSVKLPGVNPQVIVSGDPTVTDYGGWGRLYELAESTTNGAANGSGRYSLATAYFNGEWSHIPLPPPLTDVAGDQGGANNSATNDYLNQISLLAVGPDENLLALRGALPTDETRQSPRRRIWLWNAASARWLLSDTLFPGNLITTTSSWSQGQLTFWLMTINLTAPPGVVLEYATFDATNTRQQA